MAMRLQRREKWGILSLEAVNRLYVEILAEYSDHAGRSFQRMPATCSDSCRPSIPKHAGHPLVRYETGVVDY